MNKGIELTTTVTYTNPMVVAFSTQNVHVMFFERRFYVQLLAPGRESLRCVSGPRLETSEIIQIERGDPPGGVTDISTWYQLFFCGQMRRELTGVRGSGFCRLL